MVDATAAGDAFRAAFTVALVEGRSIAHALRWGAAAGAHAVTRMGALPRWMDGWEQQGGKQDSLMCCNVFVYSVLLHSRYGIIGIAGTFSGRMHAHTSP